MTSAFDEILMNNFRLTTRNFVVFVEYIQRGN